MALIRVTLTAAITASQLQFGVSTTANAAFPAAGAAPVGYQPFMVDDEMMFLVSVPAVNTVVVRMRGSDGTDAVPHDVGSACITSATPSDFPAIQAGMLTQRGPSTPDIVTYGQSGAIAVPIEPMTMAFLAATSAGAYTIGAPSLAMNGMELQITSQTAFAHVITATGLLFTGAAGGPFTTATFLAAIGASMNLEAQNGFWNVVNASITPVVFT